MKPKHIFAVAVRILGVIVFLYGLADLLEGLLTATGLTRSEYFGASYWGVRAIVEIVAGLLIMRGTVPIVDIAFPSESSEHDEEDDKHDVNRT